MHSRAEGFWHVCGESWADHGCLRYVSKSAIFVNFSAHSLLSPRVMHANILNQQIIPHNPPTPVHSRDKNNQKPSRMTCPTFVTSSTRRSFFVSPGSRTHAPTEYPEEKSQAKRRRTLNSWHTVAENCHQPRKGEGAGAAIDESRFFSMPLIWIARILTPVLDHFWTAQSHNPSQILATPNEMNPPKTKEAESKSVRTMMNHTFVSL